MTPDGIALADAIETTSCCERHVAEREALEILGVLAEMGWVLQEIQPTAAEAGARRSDPETSRVAAESIDNLTERQGAVLSVAQSFIVEPWTYDDLCARYKAWSQMDPGRYPPQEPPSIRSRAKELRDAGWIARTGSKGRSKAGRPAQLWRAAYRIPAAS